MSEQDWRAKKRDETDLQWRMRIAQADADQRCKDGPIVTPEAEQHGDYHDEFVMHVETQTLARTMRNRRISSMVRLHQNGVIDNDQFVASQTIAAVVQRIQSDTGISRSNLQARVDNSRGTAAAHTERLDAIRDEAAYTKWRNRLPVPKALVIDLILLDQPLAATARKHKVSWVKARGRLKDALDSYLSIRRAMDDWITEDDAERAANI